MNKLPITFLVMNSLSSSPRPLWKPNLGGKADIYKVLAQAKNPYLQCSSTFPGTSKQQDSQQQGSMHLTHILFPLSLSGSVHTMGSYFKPKNLQWRLCLFYLFLYNSFFFKLIKHVSCCSSTKTEQGGRCQPAWLSALQRFARKAGYRKVRI